MKTILALAVLVFVSQACGYSTGQAMSVKGKTTKYCQDCENFLQDVKQIMASVNTSAEIEQLFNQMVCAKLGAFQQMCEELAKTYITEYMKSAASELDPRQICGVIGMCTEEALKLMPKPVARKQVAQGQVCDLCKDTVNELKDLVQDKQTQDAIKSFLDKVCSYLGNLSTECKQQVDTYLPLVFQILENELDPVMVCQSLGLCSKNKTVHISRVGLTSSSTKVKVIEGQKKVKATPQCVLCEFVMKEVQEILQDNKSKEAIEAALDKVCGLLPKTLTQDCQNLVDQYGPLIISILEQEINPTQVCTAIGLCTNAVAAPASAPPAPGCVLCEFVMREVDKLIGQNSSQAAVVAALEKVCNIMPTTIRAECVDFVQVYSPAIINLLEQELDPASVCKALQLCSGNTTAKVVKKPVSEVVRMSASLQCTICEFVMNELDTLLEKNATQEEIEAALDKVCSLLPSTVTQECVAIVNQYGPAIMELLVQELDPQEICTALGLCSLAKDRKAASLKLELGGEVCDVCKTVVMYADELLKENATVQDAEMVLDKVCNFFSDPIKSQCNMFVDEYIPLVMNLLANDIDPKQICEEIKLCNATSNAKEVKDNKLYFKTGLLGKDKCTYGPSYWCINKENAKRCQAVEHCEKHVWN